MKKVMLTFCAMALFSGVACSMGGTYTLKNGVDTVEISAEALSLSGLLKDLADDLEGDEKTIDISAFCDGKIATEELRQFVFLAESKGKGIVVTEEKMVAGSTMAHRTYLLRLMKICNYLGALEGRDFRPGVDLLALVCDAFAETFVRDGYDKLLDNGALRSMIEDLPGDVFKYYLLPRLSGLWVRSEPLEIFDNVFDAPQAWAGGDFVRVLSDGKIVATGLRSDSFILNVFDLQRPHKVFRLGGVGGAEFFALPEELVLASRLEGGVSLFDLKQAREGKKLGSFLSVVKDVDRFKSYKDVQVLKSGSFSIPISRRAVLLSPDVLVDVFFSDLKIFLRVWDIKMLQDVKKPERELLVGEYNRDKKEYVIPNREGIVFHAYSGMYGRYPMSQDGYCLLRISDTIVAYFAIDGESIKVFDVQLGSLLAECRFPSSRGLSRPAVLPDSSLVWIDNKSDDNPVFRWRWAEREEPQKIGSMRASKRLKDEYRRDLFTSLVVLPGKIFVANSAYGQLVYGVPGCWKNKEIAVSHCQVPLNYRLYGLKAGVVVLESASSEAHRRIRAWQVGLPLDQLSSEQVFFVHDLSRQFDWPDITVEQVAVEETEKIDKGKGFFGALSRAWSSTTRSVSELTESVSEGSDEEVAPKKRYFDLILESKTKVCLMADLPKTEDMMFLFEIQKLKPMHLEVVSVTATLRRLEDALEENEPDIKTIGQTLAQLKERVRKLGIDGLAKKYFTKLQGDLGAVVFVFGKKQEDQERRKLLSEEEKMSKKK